MCFECGSSSFCFLITRCLSGMSVSVPCALCSLHCSTPRRDIAARIASLHTAALVGALVRWRARRRRQFERYATKPRVPRCCFHRFCHFVWCHALRVISYCSKLLLTPSVCRHLCLPGARTRASETVLDYAGIGAQYLCALRSVGEISPSPISQIPVPEQRRLAVAARDERCALAATSAMSANGLRAAPAIPGTVSAFRVLLVGSEVYSFYRQCVFHYP